MLILRTDLRRPRQLVKIEKKGEGEQRSLPDNTSEGRAGGLLRAGAPSSGLLPPLLVPPSLPPSRHPSLPPAPSLLPPSLPPSLGGGGEDRA